MRVNLDANVFSDSDALSSVLDLIRCFVTSRHDWVTDSAIVGVVDRYFTEHAPRMAGSCVELAKKSMVALTWSKQNQSTVLKIDASDLAKFVEDLCRPAVLVVENSRSDEYFIKAISRAFKSDRIQRALDKGWIEIEHGGGSTLRQVAERAASRFHGCVRVVAVLDSDRMTRDHMTQSHKKAAHLKKSGMVVHVLELREAENYTPNAVLAAIAPRRTTSKKVALLKCLSAEQRGYFDMKRGFGSPNADPIIQTDQQELFSNLGSNILRGLRGGFGNDVLQRMYEISDHLTESDFIRLGSEVANELRDLLAEIENVI